MNKIIFPTLAIAIVAIAGVVELTVTQQVQPHCDGIGNCNGIQGSGSCGSRND
jgi:citrate lyase alpha subunit